VHATYSKFRTPMYNGINPFPEVVRSIMRDDTVGTCSGIGSDKDIDEFLLGIATRRGDLRVLGRSVPVGKEGCA
jgi:hypothetical protein